MPGGVPGNVDHREAQPQQLHRVAIGERHEGLGDSLGARAVDGALQARPQLIDAADMIAVMMRH